MSGKRKRTDFDDSDDEEPTLGKQVLPIANLPQDFDGIPEDGLQYLFMVRRDARTLPHVTRVANPYELREEPRDLPYSDATLSAASSALPSESWREVFLTRFKNFRKNCIQPTIHSDLPRHASSVLMPDMKERDAWWAFLQGYPESEWNLRKRPKKKYGKYADYARGMRGFSDEFSVPRTDQHTQLGASFDLPYASEEGEVEEVVAIDPAETLPTPHGSPPPAGTTPQVSQDNPASSPARVANVQPEPTPMLLKNLDHRYSLHLLMYFAYWINLYLEEPTPRVCRITETHARWMFMLLSRVDEYLSADEMSTLRSLARGCMGLLKERLARSEAVEADAEAESSRTIAEASCWMIIAAVGGLWGQRDLWQDAQDALSGIAN